MDKVNFGFRSVIFKEGDKASKLYLIKSGEVLCLKFSKDRLIPVFLAKEGDIIGESAIVPDLIYTYSAISLANTELIEVSSFSFKQVFSKSPGWLQDLTTTMISRFQNTSSLIAENRMVHPSIIDEDQFTSQLEIEFKKLLT
ncbi:MAG: Crp/Fnr family transcriptional regulator [Bacteriovoracia bacterium]